MPEKHELTGPEYFDNYKQEFETELLRILHVQVAAEQAVAHKVAELFGYGVFENQRVDTFDATYLNDDSDVPQIDVTSVKNVKKYQTLGRTDLPLLEGKYEEKNLPPLLRYMRQYALDEAAQLQQLTWDVNRPGELALVGARAQQTSELHLMGTVMKQHGYDKEFKDYAYYYSHTPKGYASSESMLGFQHSHGTIGYFLARYNAVKTYYETASAKKDLQIIIGFIGLGLVMRQMDPLKTLNPST